MKHLRAPYQRFAGGAFRTWASHDLCSGALARGHVTNHAQGRIEEIKNSRFGDTVVNIPAVAAVAHQASFAQRGELLREIRLPVAEMGFQVTDARFTSTQLG